MDFHEYAPPIKYTKLFKIDKLNNVSVYKTLLTQFCTTELLGCSINIAAYTEAKMTDSYFLEHYSAVVCKPHTAGNTTDVSVQKFVVF